MQLKKIYYLNEVGEKKNQEDSIWPEPGTATLADDAFVVCDGVGGSEKGELASSLVADYIGRSISSDQQRNFSEDYICRLLGEARQELSQYAKSQSLNPDMATTFTLIGLFREKNFFSLVWRQPDLSHQEWSHSL